MINSRALIITGFVFLFFLLLLAKLFSIQILKNEYYTLIAERQQNKPRIIKAERGVIKDSNGEVLSFTRDNVSFFVDTRMMNESKIDTISKAFSKTLGKPVSYYKRIIRNGKRNVCIAKKVPMSKAFELKKLIIDGFFYEEDFTRVYPYGNLAAHLIGYVNRELKGVEGIEKVYDDILTGKDGRYLFERDVLGKIISVDEKHSVPPSPGNNVVLTINKTYQKILQEELIAGIKKYNGNSGVGIIMNPNNGAILALANIPDFDPANYNLFTDSERRNRALTDTYEPGSTIKPFILSILFNEKLADENEPIDVEGGKITFYRTRITDTHPHDILTVREVLEQSSNVGMAKLSTRIPDELFYRYLRNFGFGNPTYIEISGEAEGYLKKPKNFSKLSKAFMSFGYEFSVTPLQMITAFSALINGGILYKPYVVEKITNSNGEVISASEPKKIRRVIDKVVSDKIREMMIGVVENGTATAAQLDYVYAGGKTGTSQKLVDGKYVKGKYNSSFIGYLPADNPQIVCLILIDSPEIARYGGLVAAPVFKNVANRLLEYDLNLAPVRKKIVRKKKLIDKLIAEDINAKENNYDKFFNPTNEKKILPEKPANKNIQKGVMPDLRNMNLRDAIVILNELGVKYKISGSGKVVSQSIEPGAKITAGAVCNVKCQLNINKKVLNLN
ncbi:penicillin-binding protein [Melioribacter sp. Ez-97]|uniref:penicillin-binding protein n=1 Tax=Melioribacter sp. Ez-97 TaxID=3423434 RepID=UPI003ED8DF6F